MTSKSLVFLVRVALGVGLVAMLGGCVDSPQWGRPSRHGFLPQFRNKHFEPGDYVYFPGYVIYYNRTAGEFTYWTSTGWVTRREPPPAVSPGELMTAPSVTLDFHDRPEWHHEQVAQTYPRTTQVPAAMIATVP